MIVVEPTADLPPIASENADTNNQGAFVIGKFL
jgi:hypothetical protein